TDSGTVRVTSSRLSIRGDGHLTVIGSTLLFTASDGVHGQELWKTDGTAAGTVMVKDIDGTQYGSYPSRLTNVAGTLFFFAADDAHGNELWKSDSSAAGTVLVKDIAPGQSSSPYDDSYRRIAFGNLFCFEANDGTHGRELWRSDGT